MCRCRGCNNEIEVKWWTPQGTKTPILEDLCNTCLAWAEVAKQPGPMPVPSAKRKPKLSFLGELASEEDS